MTFSHRARGKTAQAEGNASEQIVEWRLRGMGFSLVEKVSTPWVVLWRGGQPTHAFPAKKVSGDFRAVGNGGQSVLVECKSRKDGILSLSDFEPHQVLSLDAHRAAGGLSLVAWVYGADVRVLPWPIAKLTKGNPLHWKKQKND